MTEGETIVDKDILSVEIKCKISKYGPEPRPPTVIVELATGEKAMEIFGTFAKNVVHSGPIPRGRRDRDE